jgi:hypothetical protein
MAEVLIAPFAEFPVFRLMVSYTPETNNSTFNRCCKITKCIIVRVDLLLSKDWAGFHASYVNSRLGPMFSQYASKSCCNIVGIFVISKVQVKQNLEVCELLQS